MYCIDLSDVHIKGVGFSEIFERFVLRFDRCTGPACASEQEINYHISNSFVNIHTQSHYFDFKDIENLVKHFIDIPKQYMLNLPYYIFDSIKLVENQYTLYDDLFQLTDKDYDVFYSLENGEPVPRSWVYPGLLHLEVDLSRKINQYERRLLSIWDVTGLLGGIYEMMFVTCSVIFGFVADKLFYRYSLAKLKFWSTNKYFYTALMNENTKVGSIAENNLTKGNSTSSISSGKEILAS